MLKLYYFKPFKKKDFSLFFNFIEALLNDNKANKSKTNNSKTSLETEFWDYSVNKHHFNS